ncbi:MAG: PQQ-binding-like beta-propeller repeat protein [Alphaproteobacteria bacterium]|jgi:alcohol dehydrogenase (cytochrome c)|nr:PQQ-binding-like beta-propeller repeat protein [Alphaproteobacteria bacterium]MBT5859610.1 PQQ-binding-like beta-propeller repeat protein [Alphaproteobacteria bacterium]
MKNARKISAAIGAGLLAAAVAAPALAAPVANSRLMNASSEPSNWLTTHGNWEGHRYSGLTQINRGNVGDLKLAFAMPLKAENGGSPGLQGNPLVDDGMLFMANGHGAIYKVDVRDGNRGKVLWVADPGVDPENGGTNRGIAMHGNTIIANLVDGRVIGVDRATGEILWDEQVARITPDWAPTDDFYSKERFTAAPLVAENRVLVGMSNGDSGHRGWIAALDADNGMEHWRTYTIPGPGEPGHETWADDHNAWMTGGGSLWTTGSYDVEMGNTIWGTANPVPMFDPEFRPGDNLWTNAALAWNVQTGEQVWGFQYTPNESWDFDEQGVHFLFDATIGGADRKVVAHFGRNGFYYQLDRETGDFILGTQFVNELNWTAGLDPKTGKPIEYDPSLTLQTYIPEARGFRVRGDRANPEFMACPTMLGGVRWQPPAYNPVKQIAYVAAAEGCTGLTVVAEEPVPGGGNPKGLGQGFFGGLFNAENLISPAPMYGAITAMDVTTGKMVAKATLTYENLSGLIATAGGLIFTGNRDGSVAAYNDETLEELWSVNVGIQFKAPPISYAVGGVQYIAIMAGGSSGTGFAFGQYGADLGNNASAPMLFVFSL